MVDHVARVAAAGAAETLAGSLLHGMRALCPDVGDTVIERRPLDLSPRQLAAVLPSLGKLLYLARSRCDASDDALPPGLLTDMVELMPLLQFRQLQAASLITVEGPCEWIECLDRCGHASARLYLLPDSDYLAWDGLHAAVAPVAPDMPAASAAQPCLERARIVQFRQRAWAGMQLLSIEMCMCISPISCRVARRIVRSEVVSGWLPEHH
ncbi:MAG TPA: hypothetical protein VN043_03485 [Rhodanobacter sp.]|nr:hypothetical protein [Rhodanobacter sp.]